jgi:prepilin-type processing-associated H-X9-DG protein
MTGRRGFNLSDAAILSLILFGVLIIAYLALKPSLGGSGRPQRSTCSVNLKCLGNAFNLYEAVYGKFPTSIGALRTLCDEPRAVGDALINISVSPTMKPSNLQKWFYCPGNAKQDPVKLWSRGNISTWGYVMLNDRGPAGDGIGVTFPPRNPPLAYRTSFLNHAQPSIQELALDVIESDNNIAPMHYSGTGTAVPFGTNHMASATKPAGANVLAFDGHVAWRIWDPAQAAPVPQPAGGYLWIPNP